MVDSNPEIPEPGAIMEWVRDLWGVFTAVGIRRQADPGNPRFDDVVTLARLLKDIAAYPGTITRAMYVDRFGGDERAFCRKYSGLFDRFAGQGGAEVHAERVMSTVSARWRRR